jgi:hypothetical protein
MTIRARQNQGALEITAKHVTIVGDIKRGDILIWGSFRKVFLVVDVYELADFIHVEYHNFTGNTRGAMSGRKDEKFYFCKRISYKL